MAANALAASPVNSDDDGWERLFGMVFRRSTSAIALVDESRRFVDVNDAFVSFIGHSRASLLGEPVAAIIAAPERSSSARHWEALLLRGDGRTVTEIVRPDGSTVAVSLAGQSAVVGGRRLVVYALSAETAVLRSAAVVKGRTLTTREREVVTLIALGSETDEIARQLTIAPETVRSHVRNAMTKLGTHTRAQLVAKVLTAEHALYPPRLGYTSVE